VAGDLPDLIRQVTLSSEVDRLWATHGFNLYNSFITECSSKTITGSVQPSWQSSRVWWTRHSTQLTALSTCMR